MITVVETRGGRALVVHRGRRSLVYGWVAAADVLPGEHDAPFDRDWGREMEAPEHVAVRAVVRCDHDLPSSRR